MRDGVLVLQTLLWPDEVREAEFTALDTDAKVSAAEKKMASMLVESYSDDFHPENFTDTYRAELQQLIEAKISGGEAFPEREAEPEGEDAEVVDLLAALERSVAKRKGGGAAGAARSTDSADDADDTDAADDTDDTDDAAATTGTSRTRRSSSAKTASDKPARKPAAAKKTATKPAAKTAAKPATKRSEKTEKSAKAG